MKWAPSELDRYSHALTPLAAQHPDGVRTAVCGRQLPPGVPLYEDAPDPKCLQCVLDLLTRDTGVPAAVCTCTAAEEIACLWARMIEFIELAEAPGLWVGQLATVADQARNDLEKFRGRQIGELAQQWTARQPPEAHPLDEDGGWHVRQWKWVRSIPWFVDHVVDSRAEQPIGVLKAACGEILVPGLLRDEPPRGGDRCPCCVRHYGAELLRAMVELVERIEADGLTSELADRAGVLAHQTRQVQLPELVDQWVAVDGRPDHSEGAGQRHGPHRDRRHQPAARPTLPPPVGDQR